MWLLKDFIFVLIIISIILHSFTFTLVFSRTNKQEWLEHVFFNSTLLTKISVVSFSTLILIFVCFIADFLSLFNFIEMHLPPTVQGSFIVPIEDLVSSLPTL